MVTAKNIILPFFTLTFVLGSKCQTIEKTFSAWWGDTWWIFDFHKNNTYERNCSGHYGSTQVEGNYKISNDTVQLLSGFKNTDGTVNEFYLLDRDSFLIDLRLLYDYKLTSDRGSPSFNSRRRYDILPKPDPKIKFYKSYSELDTLVREAIIHLQTKDLWYLSDNDHLNIIRLYNTLTGSQDTRLAEGLYKDFKDLLNKKKYLDEVLKIYNWRMGTGMGYVILKLQVEIGGSPNWYSIYIPK